MENANDILNETAHRRYALPAKPWQHYQEWHGNIMLHWKVSCDEIKSKIPNGVELDLFEGQAWVSLIAFSVCDLRTEIIPPLSFISDFHEINLRTYVIKDGKPGIYFFSIEAEKRLPVVLAKVFMGLPYKKSAILRNNGRYLNNGSGTCLDISYKAGPSLPHKTLLDIWLTERHCLYDERSGKLFRIDIHHKEWPLRYVNVAINKLIYPFCVRHPDLVHYADKISVLVWAHQFLDSDP